MYLENGLWQKKIILLGKVAIFLWLCLQLVYGLYFVMLYPVQDEASLLNYISWLIDEQKFVPYRDVFETAFPGTFLFYMAIGHLGGYEDVAFRLFDAAYLFILMLVTWRMLRPIGSTAAWITAMTFGSLYLREGPSMTLQRDYIVLLPIALALLLSLRKNIPLCLRAAIIGLLFGSAASIKPMLAIGGPVALWLAIVTNRSLVASPVSAQSSGGYAVAAWGGGGFFVGFGAPCVWLLSTGGFPAFLEMLAEFMPLYLHRGGLSGSEGDVIGIVKAMAGYVLWTLPPWVPILLASIIAGRRMTQSGGIQKKMLLAFPLLCLLYYLYVFSGNKFYAYHWMPFKYFGVISAGFLLMRPMNESRHAVLSMVARFVLYIVLIWHLAFPSQIEMYLNIKDCMRSDFVRPQDAAGNAIAAYLSQNSGLRDTVIPIDNGGSAMHGLLMAKAIPGMRYFSFESFFHSMDDPFVVGMQEEFIGLLSSASSRYIVNTYRFDLKRDEEAAQLFKGKVDDLMAQKYHLVDSHCIAKGPCFYRIYERN